MTVLTLRRPNGQPSRNFHVEKSSLPQTETSGDDRPRHHIIIVDRSGSMWGSMDSLKSMLTRLLAVQEYHDDTMMVSLLSYASQGNLTTHFQRVPVKDIQSGTTEQTEIRNIRAGGLTCISQALNHSMTLVEDDEVTVISLHSDGYANHTSPFAENQKIQAFLKDAKEKPNLRINTIAYTSYSDFALLDHIANQGGGKSVLAKSVQVVFDALSETTQELQGSYSVLEAPLDGASYILCVDPETKKVLAGSEDLKLRGMSQSAYILRLFPTDKQGSGEHAVEAARGFLSLGLLTLAKQAVIASRVKSLEKHIPALLPADLGEMAMDLEDTLFNGTPSEKRTTDALDSTGPTVMDIARALRRHASHIRVHLPSLRASYIRRGIRRVDGIRQEDGSVTMPKYRLSATDDGQWVGVSSLEVSSQKPNLNLLLKRPAELKELETGKVIEEVAGIPLAGKLNIFNNYTLVGDGKVLVPQLVLKISNKKAWAALSDLGLVQGPLDPTHEVTVNLKDRPVVEDVDTVEIPKGAFDDLARVKTVISVLSAMSKTAATTDYTEDQIKALKEHYITVSAAGHFNVSVPSTTHFDNRDKAIEEGLIDNYTGYKVSLGTTSILDISALKSANALLKRFYEVKEGDKKLDKATFDTLTPSNTIAEKQLSARVKVTDADVLQKGVLDALVMGKEDAITALTPLMKKMGLKEDQIESLWELWKKDREGLKKILTTLNQSYDDLLEESISGVAFLVGSTGMFPDDSAPAMTAADLKDKFKLKVASKLSEGTFFQVGDHILTVAPEIQWFSTDRR